MFSYHTQIHLRATDATGVLYFPEQFRLALETLEEYLKKKGFPLNEVLRGDFLMPVVHAEGDYFAPLEVADEIEIKLKVAHIGTSSFTLDYQLLKKNEEVGHVSIVHVTVSKKTRETVPIPPQLRTLLESA